MDVPSCPMLMEDSIMGRMKDISPASTSLTLDSELPVSAPAVNKGSRVEITSKTGIARNLAISLRLARDLSSFEAIANATGLSQSSEFPLGM